MEFTVSLREPNKVDLVSRTKGEGEYMLVIVIDEPWQDSEEFRARLLDKLNNYSSYFLDGQMRRQYPDCLQSRMPVRLSSTERLSESARAYIARLATTFGGHGLDIEARELD
jgi:hypothetical protein